ncbi:MAG TPA: hypothetical protein VGB56_06270 [Flavisolibacter sp.]|jgi:hypothetical protein
MKKHHYRNYCLIILAAIAICSKSYAQPGKEDIRKLIATELDSVRKGSIKANDYVFTSDNERDVLFFLVKYENDPSEEVRLRVQSMKFKLAQQSRDTSIRQRVVEDMARNFQLSSHELTQYAVYRLSEFGEKDFSDKTRKILFDNFERLKEIHQYIVICGVAQVKALVPRLKQLSQKFDYHQYNWYSTEAWHASLALARMGENEKMDAMIAAVELEAEPTLRMTRLLRQVAHTRHPDAIKLLQKYLESGDEVPSSKPGAKGIEFRHYAVEYLAQYVEGFPIVPRSGKYSVQEIESARKFLSSGL